MAKIFEWQVLELVLVDDAYRQSNRVFFLPTAEPISKNHYVGNTELFVWTAGIGFWDYVSVNMMRSTLPWIESRYQFSQLNVKASIYRQEYETMKGHMNLAAGAETNLVQRRQSSIRFVSQRYVYASAVAIDGHGIHEHVERIHDQRSGRLPSVCRQFWQCDRELSSGGSRFCLRLRHPIAGQTGPPCDSRALERQSFVGQQHRLSSEVCALPTAASLWILGMSALTTPTVIPVTSFSWTPF